MGKKIIIKGANFTEIGVELKANLFISTYSTYGVAGTNTPVGANGGWAWGSTSTPSSALTNKTINFIRFVPKQAGILNFYRCTDPTDSTTLQLVTSMEIAAADVGQEVTHIFESVTLGNEYFVIGEKNSNQGLPGYAPRGGGQGVWIGRVPSDELSSYGGTYGLRMDIGYIDYQ